MIASFIDMLNRYKFVWLTAVFMILFIRLGLWQLHRAQEKEWLLQKFAERAQHKPLSGNELSNLSWSNSLYYQVQLIGKYDNFHTFYLDNKTFQGQAGYEIFTPFKAEGFATPILVDRGWLPAGASRAALPKVSAESMAMASGTLTPAPHFFALGSVFDGTTPSWPLRIEFMDLQILSKLLGYSLFPYILSLDSATTAGLTRTWQIVIMPPEKHRGYALQWFAFALTVFILFVALNWNARKKNED